MPSLVIEGMDLFFQRTQADFSAETSACASLVESVRAVATFVSLRKNLSVEGVNCGFFIEQYKIGRQFEKVSSCFLDSLRREACLCPIELLFRVGLPGGRERVLLPSER